MLAVSLPQAMPHSEDPVQKSLRVVAIGGGTGLSTLLRGLKRYVAAPAGTPDAECARHPLPHPRP